MQEHIKTAFKTQFEEDVYKGLTEFPKHLSSKYFYDTRGDRLFQDIMNMPEYYLTDCEFDILEKHKEAIVQNFSENREAFNLVELGAGDGKKTKILLRHLLENDFNFTYLPIDISDNALKQLRESIREELPKVQVQPIQGTYFDALGHIRELKDTKNVILFLGSNIGNLLHPQATEFLSKIRGLMTSEDLLFIGFDQKKHPKTVLDAYNDKTGITEAFNKNVLRRINEEMGGNFNLEAFLHWEVYDPETGTAKSYLVSRKEQNVQIEALDLEVHFKPWETIHTEISQKYDDEVIQWLAQKAGLTTVTHFNDSQNYYRNYLFRKNSGQ